MEARRTVMETVLELERTAQQPATCAVHATRLGYALRYHEKEDKCLRYTVVRVRLQSLTDINPSFICVSPNCIAFAVGASRDCGFVSRVADGSVPVGTSTRGSRSWCLVRPCVGVYT